MIFFFQTPHVHSALCFVKILPLHLLLRCSMVFGKKGPDASVASDCAPGQASKDLILRSPPSVLSVKQAGQPVAHFAVEVQLSVGNDKEAGWEKQQDAFLTHRRDRL